MFLCGEAFKAVKHFYLAFMYKLKLQTRGRFKRVRYGLDKEEI
jgi:hypothetical protein